MSQRPRIRLRHHRWQCTVGPGSLMPCLAEHCEPDCEVCKEIDSAARFFEWRERMTSRRSRTALDEDFAVTLARLREME